MSQKWLKFSLFSTYFWQPVRNKLYSNTPTLQIVTSDARYSWKLYLFCPVNIQQGGWKLQFFAKKWLNFSSILGHTSNNKLYFNTPRIKISIYDACYSYRTIQHGRWIIAICCLKYGWISTFFWTPSKK